MIKWFIIFLPFATYTIYRLVVAGIISLYNVPSPITKWLTTVYCNRRYGKEFLEQDLNILIFLFKNTSLKYFIFAWIVEGYFWLFFLIWTIFWMTTATMAISSKKKSKRVNPLEDSFETGKEKGKSKPTPSSDKLFKSWLYRLSTVSQMFKFDYNDMSARNGGRPMIKPFLLMIKSLGFRLRSPIVRMAYVYGRRLYNLIKTQGYNGTVIYLKNCQLSLIHSISGYSTRNNFRLSKTSFGIPRIIPLVHRRRIENGDRNIIRLWLSLLSFYRVLDCKRKLKLETIYSDSSFSLLSSRRQHSIVNVIASREFLRWFWNNFMGERDIYDGLRYPNDMGDRLQPVSAFPISKSSPHTSERYVSTSYKMLLNAAHQIFYYKMNTHFEKFIHRDNIINQQFLVYLYNYSTIPTEKIWDKVSSWAFQKQLPLHEDKGTPTTIENSIMKGKYFYDLGNENVCLKKESDPILLFLGKLGLKDEPAGKIRVFAMVDAWTQWLLKPLHDYLFERLRRNKLVDGTFDQGYPIGKILSLYSDTLFYNFQLKTKLFSNRLYSFDLSAATDRLPIMLQRKILYPLLGDMRSFAWQRILVDRPYYLTFLDNTKRRLHYLIKYKIGQPMGALSSWAMLAVTHHFIIQYCWWSLGHKDNLFKDYAVLGDDVVIYNDDVAKRYRKIMRLLGLEINMSKSVVSGHSFEFAKKIGYKGYDVSPFSFKEIGALGVMPLALVNLMITKNLSLATILSYSGCGFRTMGSFTSKSLKALPLKIRFLCLLALRAKLPPLDWFTSINMRSRYILNREQKIELVTFIVIFYIKLIDRLVASKRKTVMKIVEKFKDNPLMNQLFIVRIEKAHSDLVDIQVFLKMLSSRVEYFSHQYEDGFNGTLKTLRSLLEKVNEVADFDSYYIRKEETLSSDEQKNQKATKTFCQEVAIWHMVSSHITGMGLPKVQNGLWEMSQPDSTKFEESSLHNLRSRDFSSLFVDVKEKIKILLSLILGIPVWYISDYSFGILRQFLVDTFCISSFSLSPEILSLAVESKRRDIERISDFLSPRTKDFLLISIPGDTIETVNTISYAPYLWCLCVFLVFTTVGLMVKYSNYLHPSVIDSFDEIKYRLRYLDRSTSTLSDTTDASVQTFVNHSESSTQTFNVLVSRGTMTDISVQDSFTQTNISLYVDKSTDFMGLKSDASVQFDSWSEVYNKLLGLYQELVIILDQKSISLTEANTLINDMIEGVRFKDRLILSQIESLEDSRLSILELNEKIRILEETKDFLINLTNFT